MAGKENLLADIAYIVNLQRYMSAVVTGLYLSPADIDLIKDDLSADDLVKNSVGRYRRIPVYRRADLAAAKQKEQGQHGNIVYTYVPMLSVD